MTGAFRPFLVALTLALGVPAASFAEADAPTIRIETNQQVIALVRLLIAEGRYDEARAAIATWQPDHPDAAIRRAYVEGLIASGQGDEMRAAGIYRAILAERPELELARMELAGALYRAGRDGAARGQAERLIAAGVDDRTGGSLQRLVRSIDDRRPVRVRGFLSVLPSTNVNGGTDNETVPLGDLEADIDEESRRASGIGIAAGAQILGRAKLSEETAILSDLTLEARRWEEIDRTLLLGNARIGVEQRSDRASVYPYLSFGAQAQDGDDTYRYRGIGAELNVRAGTNWRLFAAPEWRDETFPDTPDRDGRTLSFGVQADRFGGADRFVRLIGGYSGARKETERYSFDEWRVGLGAYREFPSGITLYGQALYAERDYKGDYPGLTEPQSDRRTELLATLTKRDVVIAGFAPQITLTHSRNRSNAAFDDTRATTAEVRLTRDF
ncbi:surface lipoprotein assembly modifier [Tropicimonas sp. IMCC34011]|uniref:surface lipoprotein assembly modifier n=1 Tax=Tropicimonas sp. IMCC34011 TaxID=2248759 RepID=UPI000E2320C3|nr:surface lipoprotein assembly modifier [Tropicimonas sp. IMCC34011]